MSVTTGPASRWIKAAMSAANDDCVEMRRTGDLVEVRDSKHPDGPALGYTPGEFAAWLDGAKKGEFDHLA
jgi:hypothetical protein